ncbi:MAG TPA: lamin tail domain-containing protein [Flavobacteriales bacterium]|nr:lamin tail domain-containing protein [Flavobacteriales bacterium]HNU55265.1 lamin tail domain-containing protein [Flavobacteriales bacterium]
MLKTLTLAFVLSPGLLLAQVVINEVDYDQIGTDNAEYLEIKNIGTTAFPLQYLSVVMINGNNGGAAEYRTIQSASWPALEPGGYFVICANQSLTVNCDHAATPATNLIQNGSPDAIALIWTPDSSIIDMLSYGGDVPGYTEGTGTTAEDTNEQDGLSLSRWPDGSDTDDNDADFVIGCPTPGEANMLDPVNCVVSIGIADQAGVAPFILTTDASGEQLILRLDQSRAAATRINVYAADGALVAAQDLGIKASAQWSLDVADRGPLLLVQVVAGDQRWARRVVLP